VCSSGQHTLASSNASVPCLQLLNISFCKRQFSQRRAILDLTLPQRKLCRFLMMYVLPADQCVQQGTDCKAVGADQRAIKIELLANSTSDLFEVRTRFHHLFRMHATSHNRCCSIWHCSAMKSMRCAAGSDSGTYFQYVVSMCGKCFCLLCRRWSVVYKQLPAPNSSLDASTQVWVRQQEGEVTAQVKGPMPTWFKDRSYAVMGRRERDLNRCDNPKIETCRWKVCHMSDLMLHTEDMSPTP
jgi:hypothetical protein